MMGPSLLIVINDVKIKEILKMAFRDEGYDVDFANNAEYAVQLGTTHDYMAILIDLQEKSFNALQICNEIRAKKTKTRIIAMTGYNGIYGCEECHKAGFTTYFAKPYDVQDLIHMARNAILGQINKF